ncbi:MAG: shikimate dehydrogenase family protein [Eubacteriaceae bacterium]
MKHFALIGESLTHSFSPQIHKIIFEITGLDADYKLYEIERELLDTKFKKAMDIFYGFNVTIPYKNDALSLLDCIDNISQEIGAVNTVKMKDKVSTGYNTDYFGFGITLDKYRVSIKQKKAYVIGTGGASKAVYTYLKNNGIGEITFISRSEKSNWIKDCNIITYDKINDVKGDIIINCTPLGMGKNIEFTPVEKNIISKFAYAIDLIYNPKDTLFLKHAKELGVTAINGLYMLVGQAVKSQEIWNDMEFEENTIQEIYDKVYQIMYK